MSSFLEVRVGNNIDVKQNTLCYYYDAMMPSGTTLTWQCSTPVTGQYVSVQKVAGVPSKQLVFCELKVFLSKGMCSVQGKSICLLSDKGCYQPNIGSCMERGSCHLPSEVCCVSCLCVFRANSDSRLAWSGLSSCCGQNWK